MKFVGFFNYAIELGSLVMVTRVSYRIFCLGGKHLGDLLKRFDVYLLKCFITETMNSEIQKVSANKLVVTSSN